MTLGRRFAGAGREGFINAGKQKNSEAISKMGWR